jgi:hypothetical protein
MVQEKAYVVLSISGFARWTEGGPFSDWEAFFIIQRLRCHCAATGAFLSRISGRDSRLLECLPGSDASLALQPPRMVNTIARRVAARLSEGLHYSSGSSSALWLRRQSTSCFGQCDALQPVEVQPIRLKARLPPSCALCPAARCTSTRAPTSSSHSFALCRRNISVRANMASTGSGSEITYQPSPPR